MGASRLRVKQNAGRYRDIETGNKSFENVAKFKHFGTKLVNKISICEEIYDRIISENDCYSSAQIFFNSLLLSARKNTKKKKKNSFRAFVVKPE